MSTLQKFQTAQVMVQKAEKAYEAAQTVELELALEKARLELAQQTLNLATETLTGLEYQIEIGLPTELAAKQKALREAKDDSQKNIRANEVAAVQLRIQQLPAAKGNLLTKISQAEAELAVARASVQGFELASGNSANSSPKKFIGWLREATRASTGSLPNESSSLLSINSASSGRRSLPTFGKTSVNSN